MSVSYSHPAFTVGDHVEIIVSKAKSEEGFVAELIAKRNEAGVFIGWAYKVARLEEDKTTEHSETELRGRLVIMRQFTRRM